MRRGLARKMWTARTVPFPLLLQGQHSSILSQKNSVFTFCRHLCCKKWTPKFSGCLQEKSYKWLGLTKFVTVPGNKTCSRLISHTWASRSYGQSSTSKSFGQTAQKDDGYVPTEKGLNLRLHMENVFLSWMRNSYIMTLASITITNFAVSTTPAIISTVALVLAGMNMTIGSISYLYNLTYFRRHGYMSRWVSWVCQLGTVAHFIVWYIAATILLPEFKIINEELNDIEEEARSSD